MVSPCVWCHGMYQRGGTPPSTCSNSQFNTVLPLMRWQPPGNLIFANTSWCPWNGILLGSFGMFWKWVTFIPLFLLTYSHHFVQVFKDATLFFSQNTPNLATVIPAMDFIKKVLTPSSSTSSNFSLAIRAALTIGTGTLDKYYNKTQESDVYRIAMGMFHP